MTTNEARTIRYYVLRGRQGGRYYSHRVGSTVHTASDPAMVHTLFQRREDAEALAAAEGLCAWEVTHWDSLHTVPGAN